MLLFSVVSGLATWYFTRPRLAFVRSEQLVNEYMGMKEARIAFQAKHKQWQNNLDTLKAQLRQKHQSKASPALVQAAEQNIRQYAAAMEQMTETEDQKMTQSVLDQINSYVDQYGKAQGYDLIFGTTTSGNILYGREGIDVTAEVLAALNKQYNPTANGGK